MGAVEVNGQVKSSVENAGIQRLCHFTRVQFLPEIFRNRRISPTSDLLRRNSGCIRNDVFRRDAHLECVSCSIQYPNLWLLDKFRCRYPDAEWVVLVLKPDRLWGEGTLFSPVNAAKDNGEYLRDGIAGFNAMFDMHPPSSFSSFRGHTHLSSCPTDNQAEVLVPGAIPIAEVTDVLVGTEGLCSRVHDEIQSLPAEHQPLLVLNPEFFDRDDLTVKIWRGVETPVRQERW